VRLETIIDSRHELVKIAALVDWDDLAADLSGFYCADCLTSAPMEQISGIA